MEAAWEDLPDLALQAIMEYTDFGSRKTARLVCKRWLAEVQSIVGLAINIDDRKEGLVDFVQRAVVREANISYLRCQESILDNLSRALALSFSGYVNPSVFNGFLHGRTWDNLSRLFFCGSCLISQDWRPTPSEAQEHPVVFRNLKALEIRLSVKMLLNCGTNLGSLKTAGTVTLNQASRLETLGRRAIGNVKHLLESIRSPVLSSAFLSATPFYEWNAAGEATSSANDFLEAHAKTLERLVLQQISDPEHYGEEELPNELHAFPLRGLKTLFLSRIPTQMRENFVHDLILAQNALEDVALEFEVLPFGAEMTQLLTTLVRKNGKTLKYFSLTGMPSVPHKELDLGVFQACRELRVLKLAASRGSFRMYLKNVNELPESLEYFQAGLEVATTAEFNGVEFIRKMRRLEVLRLHCIQTQGVGHTEAVNQQASWLIQAALRHRRLCCLDLRFASVIDAEEDGLCIESWFADMGCTDTKLLLNPLLAQIFRAENDVEFQTFYAGIARGRVSKAGHYRNLFDVIGGDLFWYTESEQIGPFNMDHKLAKSYLVKDWSPEAQPLSSRCWSFSDKAFHSVTPSADTAFDMDAGVDLGSEVWIDSRFNVQDPTKLTRIYELQELEQYQKERNDLNGNFITNYNSAGEGPVEVQKDGLPAFEVGQYFEVRAVKKLN